MRKPSLNDQHNGNIERGGRGRRDMSHVLAVHNQHNRVTRFHLCSYRRLVCQRQTGSPRPSMVCPVSSQGACSVMHWQSQLHLRERVHALDADIGVRAKRKKSAGIPMRHPVSSESITSRMKHRYLVYNYARYISTIHNCE